jgi:hypothetical protein
MEVSFPVSKINPTSLISSGDFEAKKSSKHTSITSDFEDIIDIKPAVKTVGKFGSCFECYDISEI